MKMMVELRRGMKGQEVSDWQTYLRGLKLYFYIVDGDFGKRTEAATKEYQQKRKLPVTGVVDNATWGKAMTEGFLVVKPKTRAEHGPNWPPRPTNLQPMSASRRQQLFGVFRYTPKPLKNNPENVVIESDWIKEHIVKVEVPQLVGVKGAPRSGEIFWHKDGVDDLVALFEAWEGEGLIDRILTWAGSWAPRFIRGSRTYLSNHCLPADASVWTPQGPIPIADLKGHRGRVWSYADGAVVPGATSEFFQNGRKPILRIDAVGHTLRCTPNHPVLVLRKKTLPRTEWVQHLNGRGQTRALYWTEMVRAENIRKGDRLVCLKKLPETTGAAPTSDDLDWAEILGLFIGDGCVHHRQGEAQWVTFSIPEDDRVRKHAEALLTRYFGHSPRKTTNGCGLALYQTADWQRFAPYDLKARGKRVPREVWGWPLAAQVRFILGLLYSDGTVNFTASSSGPKGTPRYRFSFGSRALVEDLKALLAYMGLRVGEISEVPGGERVIKGCQTVSQSRHVVSAVDVLELLDPAADPLYLSYLEKRARPYQGTSCCQGYEMVGPDFTHHPVRQVVYEGAGDVYDIEVPKHHNFIYNGVVVSNSWATAFDVNVAWNGLGRQPALVGETGSVRELVQLANEHGFFWGGHYSGRLDGMHFELARR